MISSSGYTDAEEARLKDAEIARLRAAIAEAEAKESKLSDNLVIMCDRATAAEVRLSAATARAEAAESKLHDMTQSRDAHAKRADKLWADLGAANWKLQCLTGVKHG